MKEGKREKEREREREREGEREKERASERERNRRKEREGEREREKEREKERETHERGTHPHPQYILPSSLLRFFWVGIKKEGGSCTVAWGSAIQGPCVCGALASKCTPHLFQTLY